MWNNWNSQPLLMGMSVIQSRRTTVQQLLVKLNTNLPYNTVTPLQGFYPRKMKLYAQERIMHNNDNSFVPNSSKVETTQLSPHRRMD